MSQRIRIIAKLSRKASKVLMPLPMWLGDDRQRGPIASEAFEVNYLRLSQSLKVTNCSMMIAGAGQYKHQWHLFFLVVLLVAILMAAFTNPFLLSCGEEDLSN
jgi:hypothetical protein